MHAQRKDANEADIIKALRAHGCYVKQMDKSAGFDLLVVYSSIKWAIMGGIVIAEVKNTEGKTLTRAELEKMLTKNERETMQLIQAAGGKYHIWQSVDDAMAAVGIDTGAETR